MSDIVRHHYVWDGRQLEPTFRFTVQKILADLVKITGLTAIGRPLVGPQYLSGIQLIAESHVAVHLYFVESGLRGELVGFVDVFSCKPFDPGRIDSILKLWLGGEWEGQPVGDFVTAAG